MTHTPQNLLGGGAHYEVAVTPISRTEEVRAVYAPSPPPPLAPLLSVSLNESNECMCTLSKELQRAANLSGGRYVHLVVPRKRGGDWYLDTNPKPGVGTRLPERGRALIRVPSIPKMHFQRSGRQQPGFGVISNSFVPLLHFKLGEEVDSFPGHYHLYAV